MKNSHIISIIDTIAVIMLVIGTLSDGSVALLFRQLSYPVLFVGAGFLFRDHLAGDAVDCIWYALRKYFLPFVAWSLIFLALHNLLVITNVLDASPVLATATHATAYNGHDFSQRLISILLNMSGYDGVAAPLLWIFRPLFIATVGGFVSMRVGRKFLQVQAEQFKWRRQPSDSHVALALIVIGLGLSVWVAEGEVVVPGLQGGWRELTALVLFAVGVLFRQIHEVWKVSPASCLPLFPKGLRKSLQPFGSLIVLVLSMVGLVLVDIFMQPAFDITPTYLTSLSVPLFGAFAFVVFYYIVGLLRQVPEVSKPISNIAWHYGRPCVYTLVATSYLVNLMYLSLSSEPSTALAVFLALLIPLVCFVGSIFFWLRYGDIIAYAFTLKGFVALLFAVGRGMRWLAVSMYHGTIAFVVGIKSAALAIIDAARPNEDDDDEEDDDEEEEYEDDEDEYEEDEEELPESESTAALSNTPVSEAEFNNRTLF